MDGGDRYSAGPHRKNGFTGLQTTINHEAAPGGKPRGGPSTIASRELASKAKKNDANSKRDQLFREAIKAETGATRIRVTPNEVFVILPDQAGWYWLGARDSLEQQILEPERDGRLRGNSVEAAAYRASMGY